ncbi:MAG: hypothetical protein V4598_09040 [Bdellovibrionota bacterium]
MKKLLSIVLALTFSLNVFAGTATAELEKSLDNYQYALTVEWDQKDQKFYDAKTAAFFKELGSLIQEKGLKQEEIIALAEKKIANKQTVEALKLKLALIGNVRSQSELAAVLKDVSKDMYSKGASWNGDAVLTTGLIVLVVAVVGYAIWFSATHKCVEYSERWECDTRTDCGTDYYGSVCYSDTTCGWNDYCTRYEKN